MNTVRLTVAICLSFLPMDTVFAGRLYGLERMASLDQLPCLLEGTQVRQVSSYDRSGGNDDGFIGTYSYLYIDENGEYVLFDEVGAGCLYRFWMTYGSSPADYSTYRLRFYFDGESSPRLDCSIAEFFDGVGTPLQFPLVGPFNTSSHGCYCYLPFPYRKGLKITLSGLPLFYNMTYHRFASAEGVSTWTGSENTGPVLALWNAAGSDPKPSDGNLIQAGDLVLPPGTTGTLFYAAGEGAVQAIRLDPSPADSDILDGVLMEMNWDGGESEVSVPLGDFFGSGRHEMNVLALPIGMRTAGDWYCFFPMPYWESAEIRLINRSSLDLNSVPFEVQYTTNTYDASTSGYFHARFREESFMDNGRDFLFLDETGRGHVVGLSLFMESSGSGGYRDMNYLEGDERVYIDGSRSPVIHGTGAEDYFNCGWYFNMGTFSRPQHGHPWHDQFNIESPNYTQAYRFHLSDSIPFHRAVRFGIEHGSGNEAPGTYSSVVYYYKAGGLPLHSIPVVEIDQGDAWSESLSRYSNSASSVVVHEARYAGDSDSGWLTDTGIESMSGTVSFDVPLTDNRGILLRRRMTHVTGGQRLSVSVDGQAVGVWYDRDDTAVGAAVWQDAEFLVPPSFTTNRSTVRVSLAPVTTTDAWNSYRVDAFCLTPPGWAADADSDLLPDAWELTHAESLTVLASGQDADGDELLDEQEYTAGTDPLHPDRSARNGYDYETGTLVFQTVPGRCYTVQESTNLIDSTWSPSGPRFLGNGRVIAWPLQATAPACSFRFLMENP